MTGVKEVVKGGGREGCGKEGGCGGRLVVGGREEWVGKWVSVRRVEGLRWSGRVPRSSSFSKSSSRAWIKYKCDMWWYPGK